MDIKQLEYFKTIVEMNCNISQASKKLHISQPALSQVIKKFEESEGTLLFSRSHGRLQQLTEVGASFYENALIVLENYYSMMTELRENAVSLKGRIKIGIPPLVVSVVFSELLADFIILHPDIRVEIIEAGAHELKKMLLVKEIDLAVVLKPTEISNVEEFLLVEDELCAFMNEKNELSQRDILNWSDLSGKKLSIFNETFTIHHLLMNKFHQVNVIPFIVFTSASWDLLANSTRNSELITILPAPIETFLKLDDHIVVRHFNKPVYWTVVLCRRKEKYYNPIESYIKKYICDYFKNN